MRVHSDLNAVSHPLPDGVGVRQGGALTRGTGAVTAGGAASRDHGVTSSTTTIATATGIAANAARFTKASLRR